MKGIEEMKVMKVMQGVCPHCYKEIKVNVVYIKKAVTEVHLWCPEHVHLFSNHIYLTDCMKEDE